jgi:uncharacterized protein
MAAAKFRARAVSSVVGLVLLSLAGGALAEEASPYAPANITQTLSDMRWQCMLSALCPINDSMRALIKRAMASDRSAEYLLGLTLLTGDGLPRDRGAGLLWVVRAAEHGEPSAARDIARRMRNGEAVEIDETKVAEALKPQVSAGNVEAMRALAPMYVGGRGVKQDPAIGLSMLKHAAELGSSDAETDLSQLFLNGAPGVPANRPEAMKWLGASARHGNADAMLSIGYMSATASIADRDLVVGFCWLMRSALLNQVQAQEKLSMIFAQGEKDDRGMVIAPDLIQADVWFRLAARNPNHDNSQIRAMIEPHMTTDQINQAKRLVESWHPRTVQELKTIAIPLPAATPNGASPRDCPGMT